MEFRKICRYGFLMAVVGVCILSLIPLAEAWHWKADLFSHFRPQYAVILLLALAAFLISHHWRSAAVAAAGLLLNLGLLLPHAVGVKGNASERKPSRMWRFASINLLYGNREYDAVVSYLRRNQPDIVVCEEVSAKWAAALEALSDIYPHRYVKTRKDGFGLAVLSVELAKSMEFRVVGEREADLAVLSTFESHGRLFAVAGVHPDKPDKKWKTIARRNYLERIGEWSHQMEKRGYPVVVLGDFNATPWSASFKNFQTESGLLDTSRGSIFGASWNVWRPDRLLIDHAFISRGWQLCERKIGPAVGSDHRPLLLDLALTQ